MEIVSCIEFQSTLSVRRATLITDNAVITLKISIHALREESDKLLSIDTSSSGDFNPRSPWGERPSTASNGGMYTLISIHALREESDKKFLCINNQLFAFQSTLSVRRATNNMGTQNDLKYISIHALCHNNARFPTISIHALREESD